MEDIIKKVNEFSKLARERELTEEEKKEREKYRKMYIEKFKESVRGHLDSIKVVEWMMMGIQLMMMEMLLSLKRK